MSDVGTEISHRRLTVLWFVLSTKQVCLRAFLFFHKQKPHLEKKNGLNPSLSPNQASAQSLLLGGGVVHLGASPCRSVEASAYQDVHHVHVARPAFQCVEAPSLRLRIRMLRRGIPWAA